MRRLLRCVLGSRFLVGALGLILLSSKMASAQNAQQDTRNLVVLMTMPLAGGEPQPLVQDPDWNCGTPVWSPDGKWIAYDAIPSRDSTNYHAGKIMVVSADGSKKLLLGSGGKPSWSPDGKSLAWNLYDPYEVVVGSFDADKGEEAVGMETVAQHCGAPVWLSNPRYLVRIFNNALNRCDLRKGEETVFFQPLRRGIVHGYSVSPVSYTHLTLPTICSV